MAKRLMNRWRPILLLLTQVAAVADLAIPPRPRNRIYDQTQVFDAISRERFSKSLEEEHTRYGVGVYVITVHNLSNKDAVTFANKLRAAWITDELGLVVLYAEGTDKISISLTKPAYKLVALSGQLEKLASEIDGYNEKGPELGLPLAANAILDRLRIKQIAPPGPPPEKFRQKVLITSFLLVFALVLLIVGCVIVYKLVRYCHTHNVFTPSYRLHSSPVNPILGSIIGGVNTAEAKF